MRRLREESESRDTNRVYPAADPRTRAKRFQHSSKEGGVFKAAGERSVVPLPATTNVSNVGHCEVAIGNSTCEDLDLSAPVVEISETPAPLWALG